MVVVLQEAAPQAVVREVVVREEVQVRPEVIQQEQQLRSLLAASQVS